MKTRLGSHPSGIRIFLSSQPFIQSADLQRNVHFPPAALNILLILRDTRLESAIALIHSRFSTNTFPTWDLAQPFRFLGHNGEINTIKGNRMWMSARESLMKSGLFGEDLKKIFPVIEPDKSDSASLDNVLEFLVLTGKSLPHALSMLIPESWNDKNPIPGKPESFL